MSMPNWLITWLVTGASADLLFLVECYLLHTGMVISCIYGLAFPPYVLGGLIYFVYRVKQERNRLREYGRL